jgi:hypothetical protein
MSLYREERIMIGPLMQMAIGLIPLLFLTIAVAVRPMPHSRTT